MRLCLANGEREQHKQLMDNLERRLHANHIVFWLRENYMVGSSGSMSKRSVYNHYLSVTKQVTKKPLISPTFFGKLVKRAFPQIKCNRKGPRGQTKQHYTHLLRVGGHQGFDETVVDECCFIPMDDAGPLPGSPTDSGNSSPCTPESKLCLFGNTGSPSCAEDPLMCCAAPNFHHTFGTQPSSPGTTSSRSTSPTSWMLPSTAEFSPVEQPVVQGSTGLLSSLPSNCLYCVQCKQCQDEPALKTFHNIFPITAPFVKREPSSWSEEHLPSNSGTAEFQPEYSTYSDLECNPSLSLPYGLAMASSGSGTGDDCWSGFLLDN